MSDLISLSLCTKCTTDIILALRHQFLYFDQYTLYNFVIIHFVRKQERKLLMHVTQPRQTSLIAASLQT